MAKKKSAYKKAKVAKRKAKEPIEACDYCGTEYRQSEIYHGEDPYAAEINGDYTQHIICHSCYHELLMDI